MFAHISIASLCTILSYTILAAAIPWNVPMATGPATTTVTITAPRTITTVTSFQCNTGPVQCCNSIQPASLDSASALLALLGIQFSNVTALIGINCSLISGVRVGGNSCTSQPVCCKNNNFNGVVAIGCTPINISL